MPKPKRSRFSLYPKRLGSFSKRRVALFVAAFALVGAYLIFSSFAAYFDAGGEGIQYNDINNTRAQYGRARIGYSACLSNRARAWAQYVAAYGLQEPSQARLANDAKSCYNCSNCSYWAAYNTSGPMISSQQAFDCFMAECNYPGTTHRDNILDTRDTVVGTGAYVDDGGYYHVAQLFVGCAGCNGDGTAPNASNPPPPKPNGTIQGIEFPNGDHSITLRSESTGQVYNVSAGSNGSYSISVPVESWYQVSVHDVPNTSVYWTACANAVGSCHQSPNASGTGNTARVYLGGPGYIDLWFHFIGGAIQGIVDGGDHQLSVTYETTGFTSNIAASTNGQYRVGGLGVPGWYRVSVHDVAGKTVSWTACANAVGACHDHPNASGTGSTARIYFGGPGYIDLWFNYKQSSTTTSTSTFQSVNTVRSITNVKSNLCLDIPYSSVNNGNQLQQWTCTNNPNQKWTLRSDGTIHSSVNSNKCINLSASKATDGNSIQIWDCNGSNAQKWIFKPDGTIRTSINTNKCMDVTNGSTAAGTKIQIWYCHGGTNQQWK